MIRYYGSDYAADLKAKFEYFRNTDNVNPSGYSTRIVNVTVDSRYTNLRDNARDAALMANSHICNIQGVGLSAINDITSFYEEVDRVSDGIYRDACLYYGILDNLLTTVNNLCALLNSSRQGGSYVTVDAINEACVPLVAAKINNGIANLGLLCIPPDGWDPSNAQAFRDAMAAMGITDLTDEEIALLYKIYVYLLNHGFTPEEIMAAMPYIYNSAEFEQMLNNPYVYGSSEAFAQNLAGIASRVRDAGDLGAFNYMILVDNLIDENGEFNLDVLEAYRARLIELGINDVSDEDIFDYLVIVDGLREHGYSDEAIAEMTADIYASDLLDAVNDGELDWSAVASFICERNEPFFESHFDGESDIWEVLKNLATPEQLEELYRFYNTDPSTMSARDYRDLQIRTMILLTECFNGYQEGIIVQEDDENYTVFDSWICHCTGGWCGLYASWILHEVGLVGDGPGALEGFDGIRSWGATAYNYSNPGYYYSNAGRVHTIDSADDVSGEDAYIPHVGDICVVHNTHGHVCIVSGLIYDDDENLIGVYTNDGNNGDAATTNYARYFGDKTLDFCDNYTL